MLAQSHRPPTVLHLPTVPGAPPSRHRLFPALLVVALALVLGPLACGLATPASASEVTPPVNLGAAGLTLEMRLWHYASGAWSSASTSGITCTDLTTGEYSCAGLPTATGSERYTLLLADESAPEAALAEYAYGATPGTRIVWRQEIDIPSSTNVYKQHDTAGSVSIVIRRNLPAAIASGDTIATFALWSLTTGELVFGGHEAEISDDVLDQTTGTHGATLTYDWVNGGLETAGQYLGEFTVCYSGGTCQTLPSDNRLTVKVLPDFDGE